MPKRDNVLCFDVMMYIQRYIEYMLSPYQAPCRYSIRKKKKKKEEETVYLNNAARSVPFTRYSFDAESMVYFFLKLKVHKSFYVQMYKRFK